jgi:hypothetical protein
MHKAGLQAGRQVAQWQVDTTRKGSSLELYLPSEGFKSKGTETAYRNQPAFS